MRNRYGNRSPLVAVLVCVVVVLTGCGGTATDSGSNATPGAETTQPASGGDSEAGSSGDGGSDSTDAWDAFQFDRPAKYTFDTYMEDQGEGVLIWDVTAVSGDEVTVDLHYEAGETTVDTTVSGTKDDVQSQLILTPGGQFFLIALFSPTFNYYEDRTLSVGEGWSYTTADGSASFEITGQDTYGNVECYVSEMQVDGELIHEGCFAPDLGLAAHSTYYESGEVTASMELTGYEEH